jgi:hypothetical protein
MATVFVAAVVAVAAVILTVSPDAGEIDRTAALVNGIDPSLDVRDALGLGGAAARPGVDDVDRFGSLVNGIDPAVDVRDTLGLAITAGSLRADRSDRIEELVIAVDPATDVRGVLGLDDGPADPPVTRIEELEIGIDPAADVGDILEGFGHFSPPADDPETTANPPNVR